MFVIAADVMNPQQTAAAIRQLLDSLNLSQEELGARLKVSYATINRWEAGKSKPQRAQRDAIEALASEIGVEESFASDARRRQSQRQGVVVGGSATARCWAPSPWSRCSGTPPARSAAKRMRPSSRTTCCRCCSSSA